LLLIHHGSSPNTKRFTLPTSRRRQQHWPLYSWPSASCCAHDRDQPARFATRLKR